MHVVQRMEAAGLKVFVPQRDLCAGTAEHAASVDLIKERCDKVVAIFSPSFVKSSGNLFLANFAQHVAIQVHNMTNLMKNCSFLFSLVLLYIRTPKFSFWQTFLC